MSFTWTPGNVSARRLPEMTLRTYIEQRQLRSVVQALKDFTMPAADVGCGFGRLSPVLRERFSYVIGFEREPDLVVAAQKLQPEIDFRRVKSLAKLPAEAESFGFAMTFTVLQHMTDRDAALTINEIKRVASKNVLLVEDTDPGYHYQDANNKSHFTHGRSVKQYSELMAPFRIQLVKSRQVEPTYRYKGKPRPFVGHYMLFERAGE